MSEDLPVEAPIIESLGDRPGSFLREREKASEGLYGQEADFARHGLAAFPKPDQDDVFEGDDGVRDAAEEFASARPEAPEPTKINFRDSDGNYTSNGENLAFRDSDEAAEALKAYRQSEEAVDDFGSNVEFLESLDLDPTQHLQAEQPAVEQPVETAPETANNSDDPYVAALNKAQNDAQFREMLTQNVTAAHKATQREAAARSEYASKVEALGTIAAQALASKYPELVGVRDNADLQARMQAISHSNPQRAAFIEQTLAGDLQQTANVLQASAQAKAEASQREAQAFQSYRTEQGRIFDQKYGAVSEADGRAFQQYAADMGLSQSEMQALLSNPLANDHRFQKMMLDAAKYNALKSAPARAIQKPVPPVQRPGVGRGFAAVREDSDVRSLTQKLNSSGSIDDAMALLRAQRR
jgi:hypothetical protein